MLKPQPIRVLLVEDNPGDARLVERYLSSPKAPRVSLQVANRLKVALQRLREESWDLVLLDLTLPDSDGIETFRRVHTAADRLPLIVMSGLEDSELAVRAVGEGAQDYLPKSTLEPDLLSRSIRYAMERQRSEEALRESEERYALAVKGANDGIWDWNLRSGEIYYSPRWKEMLGLEEVEIPPRPEEWWSRVHPDDLDRLKKEIGSHLEGRSAHLETECRMRHRDDNYRWFLVRAITVPNGAGRAQRMAGSLTDVHARKMTEQQLLHDAMHDALTDLPNWALFMDRLGLAIAQARRNRSHRFAVLFMDLDRFKNINDSLGHAVGDTLLISIARRLQALLRPGDTVARLGGDEFAILADGISHPSDATRIATRINEELARHFDLHGHEVFTSASIGIALGSTGYSRPEEVLRDADTAMYRAKALGRARHAIFDEEMHRRAVELLRLETDLRRAVERHEFVLHYQPIVSLQRGEIDGFEALVRWRHPTRGLVFPERFIGLAEETGLIVDIGWSVLREACMQVARWREKGRSEDDLSVSVNLAGRQFTQPDLVERVRAILEETGVEPEALRLEMTESMLMQDAEAAISKLEELRSAGIQFHIDDFGTGYSSLSYLHNLPTHTVKIDRSFVSRIGGPNDNSQMVGTIVALARSLDMEVAAEGLETAEQLKRLRELECEYGQGFFFSQPLSGVDAGQLLESRPRW